MSVVKVLYVGQEEKGARFFTCECSGVKEGSYVICQTSENPTLAVVKCIFAVETYMGLQCACPAALCPIEKLNKVLCVADIPPAEDAAKKTEENEILERMETLKEELKPLVQNEVENNFDNVCVSLWESDLMDNGELEHKLDEYMDLLDRMDDNEADFDGTIRIETDGAAVAIAGAAPYLVPVIKIALKFGIAAVETSIDIGRLKDGYGVAIFKTSNENNFQTINSLLRSDVRNGTTFDYGEWLRVFLNVQMLAGKEENVLARIGDCIQINTDTDITKGNTMMAVQADVGVKTSFMQKIADWADSEWNYDDMYMVQYKSVLGY